MHAVTPKRLACLITLASALAILGPQARGASAQTLPPAPEPGFAAPELASQRCEKPIAEAFPECRRLRFAYGPLVVQPGNNMQLIGPVTIEKPAYDGYIARMRGDIVRADGSVPAVEDIHLHHGVWVSIPNYGSSLPFFGAGEEKTLFEYPTGYGMAVRATDTWQLNYMLHNQTTETEAIYILYDVDYVPAGPGRRRGVRPVLPLWLNVTEKPLLDRSSKKTLYPVFNTQKGYGRVNPKTGRRECHYPRDRCAAFDPFGDEQPGNGTGYDWTVPKRYAGTIVWMAGHVHPGGVRDELSVIRERDGRDRARRIFNFEARYFDPGGPISWDMSMTVTPPEYRVRVEPGDRLRLNAVYDTEQASWYEGMGIVMAFVAPGDRSGVDPFQRVRVRVRGGRSGRARRKRRYRSRYVRLPVTGPITHGHLAESSNHGGEDARPLPGKEGPLTSRVEIANFTYLPGDIHSLSQDGIPRVRADSTLTFTNLDEAGSIWHSITTCKPPCNGRTGISYPIADDDANLDSLELGYGPSGWPTGNSVTYSLKPRQAGLRAGGTYTYFCRVHPFMRGAFKVVE